MFAYLGVLISVILGLALTNPLVGLSRLIQLRHSVRAYWVQLLWTLHTLIYVLGIWWGMFWWNRLGEWTFELFFFLTTYSIVLYLLATMLFPLKFAEQLDFEHYFYDNRLWFFGFQLVAWLLDIPETWLKQRVHVRDMPAQYGLFIAVSLAINVTALATARRRVHAVLAVLQLTVTLAYLELTVLEKITAVV